MPCGRNWRLRDSCCRSICGRFRPRGRVSAGSRFILPRTARTGTDCIRSRSSRRLFTGSVKTISRAICRWRPHCRRFRVIARRCSHCCCRSGARRKKVNFWRGCWRTTRSIARAPGPRWRRTRSSGRSPFTRRRTSSCGSRISGKNGRKNCRRRSRSMSAAARGG